MRLAAATFRAGLKHYLNTDVLEAAKNRIRWAYAEFDPVVVAVSGGKDSTVTLELTIEVARELGKLPVPVFWLDQEAEWQATVDICKEWMQRPEVEPYWIQVPFKIFNATSKTDHWLTAWDPERKADWVHPNDPLAYTENIYGYDRFGKLLDAIVDVHFGIGACNVAGVRCQESPGRARGLTTGACYKWVTWGRGPLKKEGSMTLYPLFDWTHGDIWKAIHEHGWHYNRIYDEMHRYGVPIPLMRVSNLHHETAIASLFYLQEIEPDTYIRLANRIEGIDYASKMGASDWWPKELPTAFEGWREYRDYILEHLTEEPYTTYLRHRFAEHDLKLTEEIMLKEGYRVHVGSVLAHDWEGVKLQMWFHKPEIWMAQKENAPNWKDTPAHLAWKEELRDFAKQQAEKEAGINVQGEDDGAEDPTLIEADGSEDEGTEEKGQGGRSGQAVAV